MSDRQVRFTSFQVLLAVDAGQELADNQAMWAADQARYPDSVLCRFLESRLKLWLGLARTFGRHLGLRVLSDTLTEE